jgi:hypothetical protein
MFLSKNADIKKRPRLAMKEFAFLFLVTGFGYAERHRPADSEYGGEC